MVRRRAGLAGVKAGEYIIGKDKTKKMDRAGREKICWPFMMISFFAYRAFQSSSQIRYPEHRNTKSA